MPNSLLSHLRETYLIVRPLRGRSPYQVAHSCEMFCQWTGGDVALDAMHELLLSRWIKHLEDKGYAPRTIRKMRGDVLGVWQDAADDDRCREPRRRRVRLTPCPEPDPEIWEPTEIACLIEGAKTLEGYVVNDGKPIPQSEYFSNLAHVVWYSGRRKSDVLNLTVDEFSDGGFAKRQQKTTAMQVSGLPEWLVERLRSYGVIRPLKWDRHDSQLYYWWDKMRRAGGLVSTGALQKIRKSAATNVAIHQPGKETAFLGHSTPAADKWYVKKSRVAKPVMPMTLPQINGQAS